MRAFHVVALALAACGGARESAPAAVELPASSSAPLGSTARSSAEPEGDLSYETALAREVGAARAAPQIVPDLTNAQLSMPLQRSTFLTECGVPDATRVTVRVAVQSGRAAGVTVTTAPPDATMARCIDHAVRGLTWPSSSHQDGVVTHY